MAYQELCPLELGKLRSGKMGFEALFFLYDYIVHFDWRSISQRSLTNLQEQGDGAVDRPKTSILHME